MASIRSLAAPYVRRIADRLGMFADGRTQAGSAAPPASASTPPASADEPRKRQATPARWGVRSPWVQDVVGDLAPDDVAGALQEALLGDPRRQARMIRQILVRDPHLVSVRGTRLRSVVNLGWTIKPVSSDRADRAVAEDIQYELRRLRGFRRGCLRLLDAVGTGYAGTEISWVWRDNKLAPVDLLYRPSEWLRPAPDDPRSWHVVDDTAPIEGSPLWPHHWVVHTTEAMPGWPVEAGLGRCFLWLYLYSRYGVADWAAYNEKFGSPLRVGRYPDGADPADIDALDEAIQQLGIDASAVIKDTWKVEFVGDSAPRTGAETYQKFLEWLDRAKSKLILGQTLTTESGPNGTQALGTVQADVRRDIRDADAWELAETLGEQLVASMVALNWGPDVPVPEFAWELEPPADREVVGRVQKARAEVFGLAQVLEIPVAMAQVREDLGLRLPDAGELLLGGPGQAGPAAGAAVPAMPRHAAAAMRGGATLLASDAGSAFDGLAAEVAGDVRAAWGDLVGQLRRAVSGLGPEADVDAALATALRALEADALVDALTSATLRAEVFGQLQVRTSALKPTTPAGDPLEASAAEKWAAALEIDAAQWDRMVAAHTVRARGSAKAALLQAAAALATAVKAGTVGQVAKAEGERATRLVDVVAGVAWGQGRGEQQRRERDRKPYLRYCTKKDDDVRKLHRAMEGKIYRADHPIWAIWMPPNGYNCRCWVEAYTLEEIKAKGWTISEDWPDDLEGEDAEGPAAGARVDGSLVLPDKKFRKDFRQPDVAPDLSGFPEAWRLALGSNA